MCYTAFVANKTTTKEDDNMNNQLFKQLRQDYPTNLPLKIAGELLGVSERRLSALIADGRKPFY